MLALANKLTLNTRPIYRFVNEHSIDFDGVDDRIITDGADTVAQNTTYSFWCKSSETGQNKGVFGHGSDRKGAFHFNENANRPMLWFNDSYYVYWADNSAQDDGEWHHWVVYADSTNIANCKLYIDSVLQSSVSTSNTDGAAYTESLTIGSDQQSGGNSFLGKIDEFAVYDRELTQAEVTRMYNTYYSPNRIANGNFSQIGNEEVTNGDFSQIGSELLTNGDFSSGSGWSGSISVANGQGTKTGGGLAYQGGVITSGKQYKIVVDVASLDGTTNIYTGGNSSAALTVGLQTIYMTGGSSNDFLGLNNGYSTGVGTVFNSISVKEVGQDWTVTGTDSTHYVEFLSTGARFVSDTTSPLLELKQAAITSGKQYIMTCNVAYTGAGAIRLNVGSNLTAFAEGANTKYFNASSNTMSFLRDAANVDCVISNVSVKEVGQHWTFGTGWSTDGTKATSAGSNEDAYLSQSGIVAGKTYKVTFDVNDYTSGALSVRALNEASALSVTATGSYEVSITSISSISIGFRSAGGAGGYVGSVDNIVVQELKHDATNLMLNAGAYQSANPLITSTKSMDFDGVDDYLTVSDNSSLDFVAGFSVSFWAYPQAADSNDRMICKGVTGTGEWMISFGSGQAIRVYTKDGDDVVKDFTSTNTLTLNEWAMVTVVVNRTTNYLQVYKNGGNLNEDSASWSSGWSNSAALTMGVNSSLAGDFDGRMTEVGIWNRELTSLEVASLYNQGMPTNLLVNRNNYQSGNPTVFNTKQVDFDGTDDYLKVTNNYGSFTGSISMWFKRDNTGNPMYLIDARGDSVGGTGYIVVNSSVFTVSSGTRYVDGVAKTTMPTDANWHHIVVTGMTLDIDEDLKIGSRYNQTEELEGNISQVGLFNSTLTADEVSSLYNHGLPIDLSTNQAAYESSSNLVGYWRMGSGTLDTYPVIFDQTNATLGSEQVTNGDFASDTWWGKDASWTISGGSANSNGSGTIYKGGVLTIGKTYKVTVDISAYTSGSVTYPNASYTLPTSTGTYTFYYTAASQTVSFSGTSFVGSIDNVSVKQVNGNPAVMTNMASTDIENGSPYANVIQNGTFDTNVDNWSGDSGATVVWQSDSTALVTTTADNNFAARQDGILTSGVTYKTTFRFKPNNTGEFRVRLGGSSYQFISSDFVVDSWNEVEFTAIADGSNIEIGSYSGNITNFYLDDVTSTEVNTGLQGYWKMGDGTNDEYPVIYDQVDSTLDASIWDGANGDTTGWTNFGNNTHATVDGALKITYVDDVSGSYIYLKDASQLSTDLTVGKTYKINFDSKVESGQVEWKVQVSGGTAYLAPKINSTTYVNVTLYIVASSTNGHYLFPKQYDSAASVFIKNIKVQELNSNAAYMTNMVEGNITNQYPLTKIRNYYRMGDGILDGYPLIADQTNPSLSNELLTGFTNGTTYPFTTFTTSGNDITSAIVSSAFAGAVSNAISVTSGQIYKVTFDYTKNSGDDLRIVFSSAVTGAGTQISNNELISSSGTYTKYFTITSTTTGYFQMGTGNSGHSLNVSINNVSVKLVNGSSGYMTNMSASDIVEDTP